MFKKSLKTIRRYLKFGFCGLAGAGINMLVLILLTDGLQLPHFLSALVAIESAIIANFTLNSLWTWRRQWTQAGHAITFTGILIRFLHYNLSSGILWLLINWCPYLLLSGPGGLSYKLANGLVLGLGGAGSIINFIFNDTWTFGRLLPLLNKLKYRDETGKS